MTKLVRIWANHSNTKLEWLHKCPVLKKIELLWIDYANIFAVLRDASKDQIKVWVWKRIKNVSMATLGTRVFSVTMQLLHFIFKKW